MSARKNVCSLNNSGLAGNGKVTHCAFTQNGQHLMVGDEQGSVCFYKNNPKTALDCVG